MLLERLRLGCGLQCTLPHLPLGPNSRPRLFSAAAKLLKFALCSYSTRVNNQAEAAFLQALYPLLCNPDEHVMATLSALVLALVEGRTALPLSRVFGAGKTRSAAILVLGLLVFEPDLRIMILTKENVAAQAFAEHIISFNLPEGATQRMGRLVGYVELQKGKTDNRHEVLWGKKLLIGCGGGYQQECTQAFSPVAAWIREVDLTLIDEGQQYGSIEETSAVARTPRTCLIVWAGDHRQTPGGLKKTEEARLFGQKLVKRPLALRTTFNRMSCT